MQSTPGFSWDCTATKCYYSLAATSHFFPFIGVMKNSEHISLPSLSLLSLISPFLCHLIDRPIQSGS